jgi:2-iminobutanoate/2-iminopropanoate deaminase
MGTSPSFENEEQGGCPHFVISFHTPKGGVMIADRRNLLKAAFGLGVAPTVASAQSGPVKKVHYKGSKPDKPPLFSGAVSYGNLLFIAGKGAHFQGDIKAHTKHVLDEVQKELENAGSSMDKVLKCNVYLNDLKDYQEMNEVFRGRFGENPPVRTTIAAAAGIPGNSLVEIDVIAYI